MSDFDLITNLSTHRYRGLFMKIKYASVHLSCGVELQLRLNVPLMTSVPLSFM